MTRFSLLHFFLKKQDHITPKKKHLIVRYCSTNEKRDCDLFFFLFNSSSRSSGISSNTKINTSPVCEWWKDLHAWCEPECMTYLQSKPILASMGMVASPMSMSPSSSCASEETCSTEDYFNKDIHQSIVNTMKQLQRGAKSISVTFSTIDKYVKLTFLLRP